MRSRGFRESFPNTFTGGLNVLLDSLVVGLVRGGAEVVGAVVESSQQEKALPCRERPTGLRVEFMVDDRPFTAAHGGWWCGVGD